MPDIKLLYQNKNIIVCIKPVGVSSENEGMPALLCEKTGCKEVFTVHRLDTAVGGIMVYAKTKKSAAYLSRLVQESLMKKEYLAIVHGEPDKCGVFEDILFKDSKKNKTFVVDRERAGTKLAKLEYDVVETLENQNGKASVVHITLHTGRTHQIRAQFSSRHFPLVGDGKYGAKDNNGKICLMSYRLSFPDEKGDLKVFTNPDDVKSLLKAGHNE